MHEDRMTSTQTHAAKSATSPFFVVRHRVMHALVIIMVVIIITSSFKITDGSRPPRDRFRAR